MPASNRRWRFDENHRAPGRPGGESSDEEKGHTEGDQELSWLHAADIQGITTRHIRRLKRLTSTAAGVGCEITGPALCGASVCRR